MTDISRFDWRAELTAMTTADLIAFIRRHAGQSFSIDECQVISDRLERATTTPTSDAVTALLSLLEDEHDPLCNLRAAAVIRQQAREIARLRRAPELARLGALAPVSAADIAADFESRLAAAEQERDELRAVLIDCRLALQQSGLPSYLKDQIDTALAARQAAGY